MRKGGCARLLTGDIGDVHLDEQGNADDGGDADAVCGEECQCSCCMFLWLGGAVGQRDALTRPRRGIGRSGSGAATRSCAASRAVGWG